MECFDKKGMYLLGFMIVFHYPGDVYVEGYEGGF